jgi:hypothetical protein
MFWMTYVFCLIYGDFCTATAGQGLDLRRNANFEILLLHTICIIYRNCKKIRKLIAILIHIKMIMISLKDMTDINYTNRPCEKFEVLTDVKMSTLVFSVVTSCGLVYRYQRFGGKFCLHLQGWRNWRWWAIYPQVHMVSQPRRQAPT